MEKSGRKLNENKIDKNPPRLKKKPVGLVASIVISEVSSLTSYQDETHHFTIIATADFIHL